jgi:L-ribulose-5-phosphate 3-epimerase
MKEANAMNPLAAHTNCYHGYPLEETLSGIAAAGFKHVELTSVPGWDEQIRLNGSDELRRMLGRHGLTPVSLSGHSELTTGEGLEHGRKAVRWAAGFGIPIVNTYLGGHGSEGEDEAAFLSNLDQLATAAEEVGVTVALEIHGELLGSGERTLRILEKIGRDSIKINYDTANCEFYGGVKAAEDLPKVASHVAHVHLKDTVGGKGVWNFPAIGDGSVDFARVLEIMRETGYEGPYSVEIEFQGEPWPPLDEIHQALRRSYDHLKSLGLS